MEKTGNTVKLVFGERFIKVPDAKGKKLVEGGYVGSFNRNKLVPQNINLCETSPF